MLSRYRIRRGARLLLLLLPALAACRAERSTGPFPWETSDTLPPAGQGFRWKGEARTYILRLPSRTTSVRPPLLIVLHGYSGTAAGMEAYTGFTPGADTAGFVLVYPEGLGHMWNAGGFLEAMSGFRDDVGFLSALVDTMIARYRVDPARVYLAGHSNGAMMAYRVAHELAHKVAAVAPVAGVEFDPRGPDPAGDVSILHIHALDDPAVPYGARFIAGSAAFPVDSTIAWWVARNRCDPHPDTLLDTGGALGRRWRSASGHGDVLLYTAATGAHNWPRRELGGIAATDVILAYFRALPPRAH